MHAYILGRHEYDYLQDDELLELLSIRLFGRVSVIARKLSL
jgi:hypothetical protein